MKMMILSLIALMLIVSGCSSQKVVIDCSNLLDECSDVDCSSYCADYATDQGTTLLESNSINNGQGCECKVDKK